MKSKTIVVEIDQDLDVDRTDGLDLEKFIRQLRAIKRQATKSGLKKIKIVFDAGYENICVGVTGTKRVELTAAELKAEETKKVKAQLRAQLRKEIREAREQHRKAVEEYCNKKD